MVIEDRIAQLDKVLEEVNSKRNYYGTVWPVIVRKSFRYEKNDEYIYPIAFFKSLLRDYSLGFDREKKSDRLFLLKYIIDQHMSGKINIFSYHLCMFLLYRDYRHEDRMEEDLTEGAVGKKRAQFAKSLPVVNYMSVDDFITAVWAYQIERWHTANNEYERAPYMDNVRILFSKEQLSNWVGRDYYAADWVEPIPGDMNLKCRTWTKEKDPMVQETSLPEGWVEGNIILGHEGPGNYRHYVQGVPVHAGSAIQVKFGDGWINGRYEWSFDPKSKVSIHSGDEAIYIGEGHLVRVRK